jgi:diguanylate cyclase (GGDEF)-like protein
MTMRNGQGPFGWAKASLRRQILVSLLAMLVPLFLVGATAAALLNSSVKTFRSIGVPVSRISTVINQVEAADRHAQATADPAYEYHAPSAVQTFDAQRKLAVDGFRRLASLTDGPQRTAVLAARRQWDSGSAAFDGAMRGKPYASTPGAPYLILPFFDHATTALDQLDKVSAAYTAKITAAARSAEGSWHRATIELLAVLAVTGIAAIALSRHFARSIGTPLARLRAAAMEVERGNLSQRLSIDSRNELGDVAEAFNAMSRSLASSQETLSHQAFHDALTGLPNRMLFADRSNQALLRAGRTGRSVAVLLLDLDDFKSVNDGHGHAAGDELLVTVAAALRACVRPEDTIARLGGDEFAVLVEDVASPDSAREIGQRLLHALHDAAASSTPGWTASVGIAVSAADDGYDALLRNADVAMYAAKSAGKNRYAIFEPEMYDELRRRQALEADLEQALARSELRVLYQPIMTLRTGEIHGFEALLRWHHPKRGVVSPLEFIPIAERTGLIGPIGLWVLEQACRQLRVLQIHDPSTESLTMSVNLSLEQLRHPDLAAQVAAIIEKVGVEPGSITLEVTESVLMEDVEIAITRLKELRAIGVKLAIDDFGTGYSSLASLRRLPVDVLKIDKSFIDGLASGVAEDAKLIRAVVELGHTMRLATVAEGVEAAEQLQTLEAFGCDMGQGYHWARPTAPEALAALLDAARHAAQHPDEHPVVPEQRTA